jgi:LytS/YehU family sensor histidine kinase
VHNTFLLKPAIERASWLKYLLSLILYLFFAVPIFFFLASYLEELLFKTQETFDIEEYKAVIISETVFLLIGSALYLIRYFFIERQIRLKAELLVQKQQIALIQSQINPHFLFNSLNSIKALTSSDPEKARNAIVLLSELLRKSLETRVNSITRLDDELVTVNDYLGLEKMRYGERLQYSLNVEVDEKQCTLPAMSLQLMVENAIKHGIDRQMDGGNIQINIHTRKDLLFIEVKNDGQITKSDRSTGIGIKNITEQLKILYDSRAYFKLFNNNDNTVTAQLVIPIN